MARPIIVGLEWDDENESHIARHLGWGGSEMIDAMIATRDWFRFPNHRGHPPEFSLLVGHEPGGALVTVILQPSAWNEGIWRPVTAWRSTQTEADQYWRERKRLRG